MTRAPSRRLRRRTLLTVAAAGCSLLTACGPATTLKLDLRSVTVNVPHVINPAVTIVPAATAPVPVALPAPPPLPPVTVPAVRPSAPSPTSPSFAPATPSPAAPAVNPCPTASTTAGPDKPATPSIVGEPAPGTYTERQSGAFGNGASMGSLSGTVLTTITRQPDATSSVGQTIHPWTVTIKDGTASTTTEQYERVDPSDSVQALNPGIYLVGLQIQDQHLGSLTFQAAEGIGVKILPDPVTLADPGVPQYVGAATDPNTLTTLEIEANIPGKQRVDACGKVIDAYTVDITGTLVGPSADYQLTWTQQLATALGGFDGQDTMTLASLLTNSNWTRTLTVNTVPGS